MSRRARRKAIECLAALLIGAVGLTGPAAAAVLDQWPDVKAYTPPAAWIAASVAVVVALIGLALGALTLARSRRTRR